MTDVEQSVQERANLDMHPLPPRDSSAPPFESGRVDRLQADSFRPAPAAPGFLVRALPAAEKYGHGKVIARMLKRDPSSDFAGSSAFVQAQGVKMLYILKGQASYDIEGLGETSLAKGTLACLPPGNRHRLAGATPDFENIEFELPLLTATVSKTWPAGGPSCATAAMIDPETSESFRPIPNFDPGVERQFPIVKEMTGSAAKALVLRANPPHAWEGTPWHIHHNNFYCSLMTSGTHTQEYEGFGDFAFKAGDFFVQQGDIRHREITSSMDFEILTFDLPGISPATVLIYDEQEGAYKSLMVTSSVEIGEAMA